MIRNDLKLQDPKAVAVYTRSSALGHCDPECGQVAEIESTLRRHRRHWTIARIYRDRGASGVRRGPQLQQLLQDLDSGTLEVDVVLVSSLDRISRTADAQQLRHELRRHGVTLLTANIDSADCE